MKLLENIFFSSSPHKLEKWLVLIVFFSIWIGVFYITGILQAGFHLTDDHEIILFNDLLKKQSVFSLISEQVYTDMLTRFRPLYYPHRILMTYVLGVNASAWAIYFCFLGVISSFLLYHALRKIGFSFFEALLFPLFAFFGEQTAVWWRLGTAETLGMLFASLSILLATVSHQNRLYSFIFIVSTLLASLSKESFILLIPALIFWKIWVEKSLSINKIDWKVAIKLNLISIIVLTICVLVEIYVISTQTNAQGTIFNATDANSNSAFRNTILLYMINKILTFNQIHILLIVFVAILLFAISDEFPKAKNRLTHVLQELIPIFLFVLLILMPQFVLYSRTDLYERYLIPATVSLGFFAVCLIKIIRLQDFIKKYLKVLFCLLGLVGLYFPIGKAYFKGMDFAAEGKNTKALLQFVKSTTTAQSSILLLSEPVQFNEWTHSFYRFMNSSIYQRPNVLLHLAIIPQPEVPQEVALGNKTNLENLFKSQVFDFEKDKDKIRCIVVLPMKELEHKLLKEKADWLKEQGFERATFGSFVVYAK